MTVLGCVRGCILELCSLERPFHETDWLLSLPLQVDNMISPLDPIPAYFFPYEVPVTPNAFSILAVLCSILGLVLFGWFFTLQVTKGESASQPALLRNQLHFRSFYSISVWKEHDQLQSNHWLNFLSNPTADSSKIARILKELFIAAAGSFFLGFAGLFLSLIVGIYV